MRRFRRILVVPVTASPEPPAALIEAVALAEASGAEVRMLGQIEPLGEAEQRAADEVGVGDLLERVVDVVERRMRGWTARIDAPSVSIDVAVGPLPAVVADAVEAGGHDLVIVAADRTLEGAAASLRIVRAAPCPVWLLRPGFRGDCVLAAIDLDAVGDHNRLILDLGRSQAELYDGRLRVMHAWQVAPLALLNGADGRGLDRPVESALVAAVEADRRDALTRLLGDTVDGRDVHLVDGSPARSVLALADLYRADLIVVGAGEKRVGSAELGPTAEQVVVDAECSVLVVKGQVSRRVAG